MFILASLVIGIPMLLVWFFMRRKAQATLRWPSTPGRIVDSRVVKGVDQDGDLTTDASVTYAYSVGGASLKGNRVSIGKRGARSSVQKYPSGTDVQVFYDPAKPSSAVLEPGGSGVTLVLVIGIAVILGGIGFGAVSGETSPPQAPAQATAQQYNAAMELYNQGKFVEARSALESLARNGSAESMVVIGVMYVKAQGVPSDVVEAQKWFILAGDVGKANREEVKKGLTPTQQQEAETKAAIWKSK
jgi:TPR repeat protein